MAIDVALDIGKAVEPDRVHRRVYADPAVFELEMERIFNKVWTYVGHESQVPAVGDYWTVQIGRQPMIMGENILILAFVVITIGGIGSIRGALLASLLVGLVDTAGRAFLPYLFRQMFPAVIAAEAGPAVASMLIYVLMAAVLYFRPTGLFPARG